MTIAQSEHRWSEIAEVLVELEDFTFDLRELAIRGYANSFFQRISAVCLTTLFHRHLLQIVRKLLRVPLDKDRIDFSSSFLIKQALLQIIQVIQDTLCVA